MSGNLGLKKIMSPDWALAMQPAKDDIRIMGEFLRAEVEAGRQYLPAPNNIFRAFQTPLSDVKVLIVGQDPYPDPKYPIGLSFAVGRNVKPIPQSLKNIYQEIMNDVGGQIPDHGDLTNWAEQGVMLLNRSLTVEVGKPASHSDKGWERITEQAIKVLNERDKPMVAILWGSKAQQLKNYFDSPKIQILESPHPSPLSAHRGFFGSKPFSKTNLYLKLNGLTPIEWL